MPCFSNCVSLLAAVATRTLIVIRTQTKRTDWNIDGRTSRWLGPMQHDSSTSTVRVLAAKMRSAPCNTPPPKKNGEVENEIRSEVATDFDETARIRVFGNRSIRVFEDVNLRAFELKNIPEFENVNIQKLECTSMRVFENTSTQKLKYATAEVSRCVM